MNQPLGRPELSKLIQAGGFIVLTGELTSCDRMMAMEIFEALGLKVSGSVSSRTSFCCAGSIRSSAKLIGPSSSLSLSFRKRSSGPPLPRSIRQSERDTVCNTVSILFARAHCFCIYYCILNCKLYL